MRLGLITYGLDRAPGGIARYTVELARALQKLPDAPDIILLTAGSAGPLADFPQVSLPGCRLLPGLLTLGQFHIPRLARQLGLDVVHDPIGVTPFAFGAGGARTVVTVHDVIPLSFPGVSTRLDSLIYRHWLPRVLPKADLVLTDSDASRADIARYLGVSNVQICYPGVSQHYAPVEDLESVRQKYGLPPRYILYIGSLEVRKNLQRLLTAFASVRDAGLPHQLVVVGAAKWRTSPIFHTVETLGLQKEVIFTGFAADADLPALYSGADLFIFPSLYEGFGLPPLEAMACGTPVITSNVSSLPEVVGGAAITVDPNDTSAIAKAILHILNDADTAEQLRQRGFQRAAQFSWTRTAREYLHHLNGLALAVGG